MRNMPEFKAIALDHIPAASAAIFYNGNKITEWFGYHMYKFPYSPPFHASFICERQLTLNVGKFKTIMPLEKEFLSTRRVDVIVYNHIPPALRIAASTKALEDADDPHVGINLPTYAFTDFLRFWKPLRKVIPASPKRFCSEDVALRLGEIWLKSSDKKPSETAPWDLVSYAMANPGICEIRTVHVGKDFPWK